MKPLAGAGLAGIAALLLAACGQAATSASQPPAAPASPPSASAPAASGKPLEKIKVSFASDSAQYAPHFIATDKGYYAAEGLDIEMVSAGGGIATPALISGDVAYSTSASSTIGAIIKGAPLKVIYTNVDRPGYELWTNSPDIKTIADVSGKSIGIQTRGDTFEVAMDIFLKQHGMDPSAVSYTPLGTGNQRLAAIQSGSMQLALLGVADAVELQQAGANKARKLADLKQDVQMLYTGVATSDKELKDNADRTKRFLRATMQGREYYKAFKEETLQIMNKYNKRSRTANEADYDDVLSAMTRDGSMAPEFQQADTEVRASLVNVSQPPPVSKLYDYSIVKRVYSDLQASGWRPQR